jgi:hypothetical protein
MELPAWPLVLAAFLAGAACGVAGLALYWMRGEPVEG